MTSNTATNSSSRTKPLTRRFGRPVAVLLGLFALLVAAAPVDDEDDYEQWQQRLQSPALKEELLRKQEHFELLDEAEQARLRDLHAQIQSSPDRARLEEVMLQYHEWLKTLPSKEREELLKLPADEKVAEIKRLMQQQRQAQFQELVKELVETKLEPEDVRGIFAWLDYYVGNHEEELLAILPETMRERITRPDVPDQIRRRSLLMALGNRTPGSQLPAPTDEDLEKLTEKLSDVARAALDKVPSREQKLELVREWVRLAVASRFMPPPVSEERLTRYYRENYERFTPQKREELESMPPEQFFQTMRGMYFQEHRRRWGRRGDGDHRGRPWDRNRHDDRDGPDDRRRSDRDDNRPRGDQNDDGPRRPGRFDGPRGDRPPFPPPGSPPEDGPVSPSGEEPIEGDR